MYDGGPAVAIVLSAKHINFFQFIITHAQSHSFFKICVCKFLRLTCIMNSFTQAYMKQCLVLTIMYDS